MQTRKEPISDTVYALTIANTSGRPLRVWEVSVYGCVKVRSGCGTSTDPIDIAPYEKVTVRTVVQTALAPESHWGYLTRSRWVPPADVAMYEATVPRGPVARLGARFALASELYRPKGPTRSADRFEAMNVRRHLTLYFEEFRRSPDSSTIRLTAEQYVGDSTHGRVGARRFEWRPVTLTDSLNAGEVRRLGERIRTFMGMGEAGMREAAGPRIPFPREWGLPTSTAPATRFDALIPEKRLSDGRWLACRFGGSKPVALVVVQLIQAKECPQADSAAHARYNAFVIVHPDSIPVGTRVESCAAYSVDLLSGWTDLEWRWSTKSCPADGAGMDPSWPNVLVIERRA